MKNRGVYEPAGDRTRDLRIKSPLLYQLSYRLVEARDSITTSYTLWRLLRAPMVRFVSAHRLCMLPGETAGNTALTEGRDHHRHRLRVRRP